jgi:hypothetical protein
LPAGAAPSLPDFKEQARERRTGSTLPRFSGTATFIFYLNAPHQTHRPGTGKNPRQFLFGVFRLILRFSLLLGTRISGGFYHGFRRFHGWKTMHFERSNLQAADWQRLPLNEQGKGGGNGKGVIGTGMQNAPIASGRSAGL